MKKLQSFIHFGATSEDVNNLSQALSLKRFSAEIFMPLLTGVAEKLLQMAKDYKGISVLARTHGQPASPTTLGKELLNFVARLHAQVVILESLPYHGKWNGATGNMQALIVAYPRINWIKVSEQFVRSLGLTPLLLTTQILPYDSVIARLQTIGRINSILIDLSRNIWTYISMDYFRLKRIKGQVGSSTMPHKVNPIDFENAEGNLGLANALIAHFAEKLPISRLQRDLSDSTVARNIGVALGHSVLAYKNLLTGLGKIIVDEKVLRSDLKDRWELLAEPIQTVLRSYGMADAYEKLKTFSQGKRLERKMIRAFIKNLKLPAGEKKRLLLLTPETYTGVASRLVDAYRTPRNA